MLSSFYKTTTILFLLTFIMACSTPGELTPGNFRKIQEGMTEQEVIDILGDPTEMSSVNVSPGTIGSIFGVDKLSETHMIWKTTNAKALVIFFQGQVKSFNFTNQF